MKKMLETVIAILLGIIFGVFIVWMYSAIFKSMHDKHHLMIENEQLKEQINK